MHLHSEQWSRLVRIKQYSVFPWQPSCHFLNEGGLLLVAANPALLYSAKKKIVLFGAWSAASAASRTNIEEEILAPPRSWMQAQGTGPHFLLNTGPGGRASSRLNYCTVLVPNVCICHSDLGPRFFLCSQILAMHVHPWLGSDTAQQLLLDNVAGTVPNSARDF